MRIAIYNGIKDVEFKEVEMPECGDNDVLVKNIYAAICGTDVSAYYHGGDAGHVFSGYEFGHEMVSKVVKVGKNVKGIKEGQYVYPYPLFAKDDTNRAATVGGFSEYILIPNCVLNKSVYLVENIPLKAASLIEPFTVGTRAARRTNPQKGESAIVFGAGAIGISSAIALKYFGCEKVMIVDLSDYRLEKCKDLGFEICNSKKEDLKEKAKDVFGKARGLMGETANVDIFIDAVGANSVVETFEQMRKLTSRICVVGVHHENMMINLMMLAYSSTAIIGSGGYMPEDVEDVMKIMQSGEYDIESIISDEYKQTDLIEAIEKAAKPDESLKVVIKYE
jgi:2-desacetyl-2-hydroxyethyl bacteriochlorophyllide A dehydrogenase